MSCMLQVSSFSSRDDLIDTVLVSCHIPYWFDGGCGQGPQPNAAKVNQKGTGIATGCLGDVALGQKS